MVFKSSVSRIFLTDDDVDDREIFAEALMDIDSQIDLEMFSSGEELLKHLSIIRNLPDIIFLDLNMPGMDGNECLLKLRSTKKFDTICIIIYSTIFNLAQVEELFNAGANRFLRKPWSFITLKDALYRTIDSIRKNPMGGQTIINYSE